MRRWVLLALLPARLTTVLNAQEVAGRIEGRVLGTDGISLSQVEVTASGPNMLGSRAATTDATGRFLLAALPPGTYEVAARRIGFRPVLIQNVFVRLGKTVSLQPVTLPEAPVELAELTITDTGAGVDPASTAWSVRLDAQQLDELPLSRNYRDIALLHPAAIPSFLGQGGGIPDGINIGGATGLENAFFVDGINITDVIHGGTSVDLPYNFIQEIEVRTGGSTAEDPQALGGVINVVTPNGGDRFRGRAFGFYSADALQRDPQPVLGSTQTGFTFYDAGATMAGPILPGRLWFFGAYNRTSKAQDYTFEFGPLRDIRHQDLFAGKLTWRAGPRTTAVFTLLGDPSHSEPLNFGSGVPLNPEVLQARGESGGVGLSLRGTHFFSPRLFIEGTAAQITRVETNEAATPLGRAPVVVDQLNGTLSGGTGGAVYIDSRRRSAGLTASWIRGAHEIRAGVLYEQLFMDQTIDMARTGAGGTIVQERLDRWTWHSVLAENGRSENRMPSVFLQDSWRLSSRFLVNAGLRWSQQTIRDPTADRTSFRVNDGLLPRLGVVYQPGQLGSQRLYASYTRVANQIVLWGAEVNGFGAETLFVFPQDPQVDTTGGIVSEVIPRGAGLSGDGTLRGETADEWAIGYDRRLSRSFELTVRVLRRRHRDAVRVGRNTTGTLLWGNPGRGALAHFPRPQRTYHALEVTLERAAGPRSPWLRMSYVLSRAHGNYPGLYGSDWALDFAHFSPLYFVPEQHLNATGLLPNDRTHVLKLFGSQELVTGLTLGASFLLASGTPLSEFGAVPLPDPDSLPFPWRSLLVPRGTSGRTSTIWDLGFRLAYEPPFLGRANLRTRILLDLEHVGSPRKAVNYDQIRYYCLDETTLQQSCPNGGFGNPLSYQPPMTARLGIEVGF